MTFLDYLNEVWLMEHCDAQAKALAGSNEPIDVENRMDYEDSFWGSLDIIKQTGFIQ